VEEPENELLSDELVAVTGVLSMSGFEGPGAVPGSSGDGFDSSDVLGSISGVTVSCGLPLEGHHR